MDHKSILITIVIAILIVSVGLGFICCNTFSWKDELPAECNLAREHIYKQAKSDSVVLDFKDCKEVLRFVRCQEAIFGKDENGNLNPIEWDNKEKMEYFRNCRDMLD